MTKELPKQSLILPPHIISLQENNVKISPFFYCGASHNEANCHNLFCMSQTQGFSKTLLQSTTI